jgi:hypothetical protein
MGIGATFGAVVGAITMEYYTSFLTFGFASVIGFLTAMTACFVSDELESNFYAL